MSARTWWSARAGQKPADKSDKRTGEEPDLAMDDLLDARFDEAGRLSDIGHGTRKRVADRFEPRPADATSNACEALVPVVSAAASSK